jgi:hypothetical protein
VLTQSYANNRVHNVYRKKIKIKTLGCGRFRVMNIYRDLNGKEIRGERLYRNRVIVSGAREST